MSILAKPIQDGLGITDGQLGRITGLYFALFYCSIAIPVGWLADRTNRVRVLSIACALVERGDGGVRDGRELPPARRRAHGGRRRRGRRRAAFLRDHLRLFPARAARHGAGDLQSRSAARIGARASRLARRSPPPSIGASPSTSSARSASSRRSRSMLLVKEPVRGAYDPGDRAAARRGRHGGLLRDHRAAISATRCCCWHRWRAARPTSSPTASSISRPCC